MGPTGALSGILTKYSLMFGPSCLPILAITSSIITFIVFALKWDKYVMFLPSAVSHGFTLGVAFIIIGGQLGSMFALPPLPQHEYFFENMYEVATHLGAADWRAFAVFAISWITLFSLVKRWPKVPWSVMIATFGILFGYLSSQGIVFPVRTLGDKYGTLTMSLWSPPSRNPVMEGRLTDVVTASLSIAFVAVLESLISGKIADGLTHTQMKQRQEVFGLGIANLLCGLAGGVPATAALARTALNIRSGATSRLAAMINAVATGAIALILLGFFEYLPLCVVAALLFQVAVGMIEIKHLTHAYHIDPSAFRLTLLVGFLCLLFDPTVAIVLGAVLGLLNSAEQLSKGYSEVIVTSNLQDGRQLNVEHFDRVSEAPEKPSIVSRLISSIKHLITHEDDHLPRHSRTHSEHEDEEHAAGHTLIYRIVGDLTYITALTHAQRLKSLKYSHNHWIVVSFRYCNYIDLDGMIQLEDALSELHRKQKHVIICGVSSILNVRLAKATWYQNMINDGNVVGMTYDAIKKIKELAHTQNVAVDVVGGSAGVVTTEHSLNHSLSRRQSLDGVVGVDLDK